MKELPTLFVVTYIRTSNRVVSINKKCYICMYPQSGILNLMQMKFNICNSYIKTHDSESRGQEEAGRTRRTSELFTRSTALKFVNALNKPP